MTENRRCESLPRSGEPAAIVDGDDVLLLEAPDVTANYGLRDRTMLELMYATGTEYRNSLNSRC